MFFEHLLCTRCWVGYNTDMNSPCAQGTYCLVVENKVYISVQQTYMCCDGSLCKIADASVRVVRSVG